MITIFFSIHPHKIRCLYSVPGLTIILPIVYLRPIKPLQRFSGLLLAFIPCLPLHHICRRRLSEMDYVDLPYPLVINTFFSSLKCAEAERV